jgi:hypothetical protein
MQISASQLAELLSGIARAQSAMINGIDRAMTGAKSTHIMPALSNVAHLRDRPQATLVDLPVRILMSYESRVGPDIAGIVRDLERLCGGAVAPAPAAPAAQDAGGDMDFSNLGGKS